MLFFLARFSLFAALLAGLPLHAADTNPESTIPRERLSFEVCSVVASEYLTVVQLYETGFSAEQLKEALPGITDKGRERVDKLYQTLESAGAIETYSNINSRYARCAKRAYEAHGKPQPGTREDHFHFCAGENKLRYEVALAAWAGGTKEQILPQVPSQRRDVARELIEMEDEDGILTVFEALASSLKECLNKR